MRVDPATTRTLLHGDPQVQEVLDIWAARFLSSQIPLGDLTATTDNQLIRLDLGGKEKVIDLIRRVTRVSVETMQIVEAMRREKR